MKFFCKQKKLAILPKEHRQTWQYLKGAKKLPRKASSGHEYIFSEGAISMVYDGKCVSGESYHADGNTIIQYF